MLSLIEMELDARKKLLENIKEDFQSYIYTVCVMLQETFKNNGKVILFADSKNLNMIEIFANELMVNFYDENRRFPAIVLRNYIGDIEDLNPDEVYERQIGVVASPMDMLIGVSYCGVNKSVLRALSLGKNLGCRTVGFSGGNGGAMEDFCDISISVPEENISILRELFIMIGDIVACAATTEIESQASNI